MMEIFSALREEGRRFGGFGFAGGRGQGALVTTGDYLVSITVNGETLRRVLRVERLSEGGDGFFAMDAVL